MKNPGAEPVEETQRNVRNRSVVSSDVAMKVDRLQKLQDRIATLKKRHTQELSDLDKQAKALVAELKTVATEKDIDRHRRQSVCRDIQPVCVQVDRSQEVPAVHEGQRAP